MRFLSGRVKQNLSVLLAIIGVSLAGVPGLDALGLKATPLSKQLVSTPLQVFIVPGDPKEAVETAAHSQAGKYQDDGFIGAPLVAHAPHLDSPGAAGLIPDGTESPEPFFSNYLSRAPPQSIRLR